MHEPSASASSSRDRDGRRHASPTLPAPGPRSEVSLSSLGLALGTDCPLSAPPCPNSPPTVRVPCSHTAVVRRHHVAAIWVAAQNRGALLGESGARGLELGGRREVDEHLR